MIAQGDWVSFMSDGTFTIGLVLYVLPDPAMPNRTEHCVLVTTAGATKAGTVLEVRPGKRD